MIKQARTTRHQGSKSDQVVSIHMCVMEKKSHMGLILGSGSGDRDVSKGTRIYERGMGRQRGLGWAWSQCAVQCNVDCAA